MATVTSEPRAIPATARPQRMTLGSVTTGRREAPIRVLVYGTEGVGKSSFAAGAPLPIFICPEDGTGHLDIARFPEPETWGDVLDAIKALTHEPHPYKSVVFDTLDWLEPMCWAHVCERDKKSDIESYGYGKGYVAALDEWRRFLAALESLRKACAMHVVLVAHSWIKSFKNPAGDDYDRWETKLHARAAGLMKEWADAVLFAAYEEFAVEKDGRVKGVSSGARILRTERTAAWDAKNRFDLPAQIPLAWDDFASAIAAHRPADPEALRQAIEEKLRAVNDADLRGKVETAVKRAGDDAAQLAKINDRLNAKLAGSAGKE